MMVIKHKIALCAMPMLLKWRFANGIEDAAEVGRWRETGCPNGADRPNCSD
jgi:hypothetical protein